MANWKGTEVFEAMFLSSVLTAPWRDPLLSVRSKTNSASEIWRSVLFLATPYQAARGSDDDMHILHFEIVLSLDMQVVIQIGQHLFGDFGVREPRGRRCDWRVLVEIAKQHQTQPPRTATTGTPTSALAFSFWVRVRLLR